MTTETTLAERKKELLSRLKDFQEEMDYDCSNWKTVKYQIEDIIDVVENLT